MAVYQTGDAGVVSVLEATDAFHKPRFVRRRERVATHGRRGWLIRRALVAADAIGITLAFAISSLAFPTEASDRIQPGGEIFLFLLTLPMWLLLAKLQGLYESDEERTDHSTIDEIAGVAGIVTLGTWVFQALTWVTGLASPQLGRLVAFWLLAIVLVTTSRAVCTDTHATIGAYAMRTLVVGAGEIGQLVARKIGQHPEYRLDLVGFVDAEPLESRAETRNVATLGELDDLRSLVDEHRIDRVIVAFSNEPDSETMSVVRSLRDSDVIVDVVPRLFDVIGPRASMHLLEGMPLVCVPPARLSRSSFVMKRVVDVVFAAIGLLVAWRPSSRMRRSASSSTPRGQCSSARNASGSTCAPSRASSSGRCRSTRIPRSTVPTSSRLHLPGPA